MSKKISVGVWLVYNLHNFHHILIFIWCKILLIKFACLILGPWCANKEEDPKPPFNGWLKAYQVAIDFRVEILSAQGIKSQIQQIKWT